ncbi:DedA family protein [Paenibacillus sediminis]|uniref:Membrane protein DedA with SNARE-associated domain n=1 Tax=Paenibacillus sediminis TaxID=664909 RepID=A0ABS4H6K1_9BACL|nr:DedA family protein [Paenibacillus sediminis]MBP1937992.1 membrane protein DedA with SNARE-associated domain [Paenibacillus sediminis]
MDLFKIIQYLFEQYGYSVLFAGLLLEFIALPFPGETTMAYAGFLSYEGLLNWELLIIFAFFGTVTGMTITYFIGKKLGIPFIQKYGKWFLLNPSKLERTQKWFQKYGFGFIFIGYFIPGVRHFTGYFAGVISLPLRKFTIYAYSGAILWVTLFIGIGRWFGPQWESAFKYAEQYALMIVIGIIILASIFVIYRMRNQLWKLIVNSKAEDKIKSKETK